MPTTDSPEPEMAEWHPLDVVDWFGYWDEFRGSSGMAIWIFSRVGLGEYSKGWAVVRLFARKGMCWTVATSRSRFGFGLVCESGEVGCTLQWFR